MWTETQSSCAWQKPAFEPSALIIISLLVVLVSAPVFVLLSILFDKVLCAPSPEEAAEVLFNLQEHRQTAAGILGEKNCSSRHLPLSKKKMVAPFSLSVRMLDHVRVSFNRAHELVEKFGAVRACETASKTTEQDFLTSLDQPHLTAIAARLESLSSSRRVGPEQRLNDNSHVDATFAELMLELRDVEREAHRVIAALRKKSPAHQGVEILQLFIADALGRQSKPAVVFANMSNTFAIDFVTTRSFKGIALAVLVLINLFFIFSCMLYGKAKGPAWQKSWVGACFVNLCMNIFLREVNIALVVHYLVPESIFEQTGKAKAALMAAIHTYCHENKLQEVLELEEIVEWDDNHNLFGDGEPLSGVLFVSAHVARAFPTLMESSLVLSYRSDDIPFHRSSNRTALGRRNDWVCWGLIPAFSLVITDAFVMLGSFSQSTQVLIVSVVNPVFVSAIAFLAANLHHQPILWLPAGLIFSSVASLIYMGCKTPVAKVQPIPLTCDTNEAEVARSHCVLNVMQQEFEMRRVILHANTDHLIAPSIKTGKDEFCPLSKSSITVDDVFWNPVSDDDDEEPPEEKGGSRSFSSESSSLSEPCFSSNSSSISGPHWDSS